MKHPALHGTVYRGVRGRASTRRTRGAYHSNEGKSSEEAIALESAIEIQGEKTQSEQPQRVLEYEKEPTENTNTTTTESTTSNISKKAKQSEQLSGPKQSKEAEQKLVESEIVSRIDLPSKSAASLAVQKVVQRDVSTQKGKHTSTSPT